MSKPLVAVFTAWPELITDKYDHFEIVIKESCQNLVQNTFASTNTKENLVRYAAYAHDRRWYHTFDYCLYVSAPVQIELSDFLLHLESDYTTYIDDEVVFYRPGQTWQSKIIDVEKTPASVGIIFIDCWQQIADSSTWPTRPNGFDWFQHMKQQLSKYSIESLVFHTGEYGNLPLAKKLIDWQASPKSCKIMDLDSFRKHYQEHGILDWIVVGAHWQRCTHDKPLGFLNLLELKKQDSALKLYSHCECTAKFVNDNIERPILSTLDAQDYLMDCLSWKPNGNLYELKVE